MTPEGASGNPTPAEGPRPVTAPKLDHVMIMVRDLRAASEDFTRLGFRVLPGSRFPMGIENAAISFGVGGPYLELVSVYRPGAPELRDNEEFLAQGEGAIYVGLEVASAEEIAQRLRAQGLEVVGPVPGAVRPEGVDGPPVVLWHSVTIQHGTSPRSDPLFFTEYDRVRQAELMAKYPEYGRRWGSERGIPHPNGANGLASAWFAVDDLETAASRYEALGFPRARERAMDRLRCRVVELALGRGSLRLLQSTGPDGPIGELLARRASHLEVPGVSLEVPSVDKFLDAIPSDLAAPLEPSDGPCGRSLLLPPELGHGVWIELTEPPGDTARPGPSRPGA